MVVGSWDKECMEVEGEEVESGEFWKTEGQEEGDQGTMTWFTSFVGENRSDVLTMTNFGN